MSTELRPRKSHRGGQKGNQNARKHGVYSPKLNPDELKQFTHIMSTEEKIEPEPAVMRIKLLSLKYQSHANHRALLQILRGMVQWYSVHGSISPRGRKEFKNIITNAFESWYQSLPLQNELPVNITNNLNKTNIPEIGAQTSPIQSADLVNLIQNSNKTNIPVKTPSNPAPSASDFD
jgi:hypothetical protein